MEKNANSSHLVETKQIRTIISGWYLLSPLLMSQLQTLTSDSYLGQPEVIQGHQHEYVNNSLRTYRISLKLAPKHLYCPGASDDMQLDLYH